MGGGAKRQCDRALFKAPKNGADIAERIAGGLACARPALAPFTSGPPQPRAREQRAEIIAEKPLLSLAKESADRLGETSEIIAKKR